MSDKQAYTFVKIHSGRIVVIINKKDSDEEQKFGIH
jgi:hypothetical protein